MEQAGTTPVTAWLAIVGIGEDGLAGLGIRARGLIDRAEILVGGARHLAMIPDDGRQRLAWPSPLAPMIERIAALRPRRVCVLATGDPMHHGIGTVLARRVPHEEITVIPAPSAFALACAEMCWPRTEVETLSLHTKPVETIAVSLHAGVRLLVLSRNGSTPGSVARFLTDCGFGDSTMTVLEHLGGAKQHRRSAKARDWPSAPTADLNMLAIECAGDPGLPVAPGLADNAYDHDGQITKREVRAATLAALAPAPDALLWDVGSGAGSIAVEWLRSHRRCRAIAIEHDPDRCARIRRNAAKLGVPHLDIVAGAAPAALAGLEPPDAIFLGGGVANSVIWEQCRKMLRPRGRLVANAVTTAGEMRLLLLHAEYGGALTRIAVSRAEPMGASVAWRALRPVTQLVQIKP